MRLSAQAREAERSVVVDYVAGVFEVFGELIRPELGEGERLDVGKEQTVGQAEILGVVMAWPLHQEHGARSVVCRQRRGEAALLVRQHGSTPKTGRATPWLGCMTWVDRVARRTNLRTGLAA